MEKRSVLLTADDAIKNEPVQRLTFIDNIRWFIIALVVLIHLNCTYGGGLWYYNEPGPKDFLTFTVFGMIGSFLQAFFMGFLFFIAGFFIPGSYDRKGTARFIRDRVIRLGIPSIIYMALLNPTIWLIIDAFNHKFPQNLASWYVKYLTSADFISGSGPLWFALALLAFSLIYAFSRVIFSKLKVTLKGENSLLITNRQIITIIVIISLFAFLFRIFYPSGATLYNMQLGNFSQYIILFCLGIVAYRRNFLARLTSDFGMFWFSRALSIGIPFWSLLMPLGGVFTDSSTFYGGLHWQAAVFAIWESFFCIGICLGLLVIFRDHYNTQGPITRFMSENAFGVYVFHAPLLVGAAMLVRGIAIYPLIKLVIMTILMLPICFGFSYLIRKIPPLKRIFA